MGVWGYYYNLPKPSSIYLRGYKFSVVVVEFEA